MENVVKKKKKKKVYFLLEKYKYFVTGSNPGK